MRIAANRLRFQCYNDSSDDRQEHGGYHECDKKLSRLRHARLHLLLIILGALLARRIHNCVRTSLFSVSYELALSIPMYVAVASATSAHGLLCPDVGPLADSVKTVLASFDLALVLWVSCDGEWYLARAGGGGHGQFAHRFVFLI